MTRRTRRLKTVTLALPIGSNKEIKFVIFVLSVGQKIKSTDFTDFTDVVKQESVIFVLSVGKKIKSTDFTDFTDVAK